MSEHKDMRTRSHKPDGVVVKYISPQRGRGMYATRDYKKGETVMLDEAIADLQFHTSLPRVRACDQCHRFLGSVHSQLRHLAGVLKPHEEKSDRAPNFGFLSDVVPCTHVGCYAEYCSEACRALAWSRHHPLFCSSVLNPHRHATAVFVEHAYRTHQFFVQAAKVMTLLLLVNQDEKATFGGVGSGTKGEEFYPLPLEPSQMLARLKSMAQDKCNNFELCLSGN